MKNTKTIVKKELKRVFGDKKLFFSLFVLPAILVIAMYSLMGTLVQTMENDINTYVSKVTIVNATDELKSSIKTAEFDKNADITYMTESEYAQNGETIRNEVMDEERQLIVYLDEKFNEKVAAYQNAGDEIPELKVMYNSAANYSQQAYANFSDVLMVFRNVLLEERLGNIEQLTVFAQNEEVLVKEEKANGQFLSMMLPYMIVMMLFAGVMSVGVDAIAGEKERGTLASMLLSPVKRSEIVAGKIISLSILSGLSSVVYSVSMIVAIPLMGESIPGEGAGAFGGVSFTIDQILMLLALMLILVYFFVAVVSLLCVLAKDVKTASTLVSPAYIVVIVCGMLTMFSSGKKYEITRYAIPIYGNALAIQDICSNSLSFMNFLASAGGTLICALLVTIGVVKAFNSEKLMFNA